MREILCAFLVAATALTTQSSSPPDWVGVWQGELDGMPSVILTLAQDGGTLVGTLVLNIISRDGGSPHIIGHEPHSLIQPQFDGARLSFRAKRIDGSSVPMNFSVELTSRGRAQIHCLNCGTDAPVVAIAKQD